MLCWKRRTRACKQLLRATELNWLRWIKKLQ
jgi:hypothetical protein